MLKGDDDEHKLHSIQKSIKENLAKGRFHVRKYRSNLPSLLKLDERHIPDPALVQAQALAQAQGAVQAQLDKHATQLENRKTENSSLTAISVQSRIVEFWVDMPRLWFAHFEAVMAPQKQGDDVSDLLTKPPEEQKYKALKERLLQVYEESTERQFQKLVSEMDLGEQKPTQLLRRIKELGRPVQVSDQTL
ncbi:unnamed protein product [Leptidea sinapis]|uniref:Uncharacterized protein n=1 Tax=Leptidea sinapis TaxID=189913 RepID=A0A5E4PNY3_9NEOP|nr:unnamed protein product [Leptidea sinapis]